EDRTADICRADVAQHLDRSDPINRTCNRRHDVGGHDVSRGTVYRGDRSGIEDAVVVVVLHAAGSTSHEANVTCAEDIDGRIVDQRVVHDIRHAVAAADVVVRTDRDIGPYATDITLDGDSGDRATATDLGAVVERLAVVDRATTVTGDEIDHCVAGRTLR